MISPRFATRLLSASVFVVLLVHIGLSVFAFPAGDDYCYAVKVRDLGFIEAQLDWYLRWSGRYTASSLISVLGLPPELERVYPVVGAATLALTFLSFVLLLASIAGRRLGASGVLLWGGVFSVLFIAGLPDIAQTIYSGPGAFTYQIANVGLILLASVLVWREGNSAGAGARIALWFAGAVLTVFVIGANEVSLVLTVLMLLAGAAFALRTKRESRWFWAGLCAVAIMAAAASVLAPGNAVRAGTISTDPMLRPQPWLAVLAYLPWTLLRMSYWASSLGLWSMTILILAASVPHAAVLLYRDGTFDRRWLLVPSAWFCGLLLLNLIGFIVNRYPLPERAESVVYLLFLLGWFPSVVILSHWLVGSALAVAASRLSVWAMLLLVVSVLGMPNVFEAFKDVYRGRRYSLEMHDRLERIRRAKAQGVQDLVLPSLLRPPRTLLATEITTDPENFRNSCLAKYHGIRTIRLGFPD